jgi:hypothetical protein
MTADHGTDEILSEVTADEYYAIVPEWILCHPEICGNAVRLYGVLRLFADKRGVAFPGLSTIGDKYGVSHDSVTRHMNKLIKVGAVTKKRRLDPKTGKATSNLYVIHSRPKFIDVTHDFTPQPGKGFPDASADAPDSATDATLFDLQHDVSAELDAIAGCVLCDDAGHVRGTRTDCTHTQPTAQRRQRVKAKRDDADSNASKLSALHAARHEDAVHDLLNYLADTVQNNGSRRPTFDAVDYERMAQLVKHERQRPEGESGAETRIRQVIDWVQTDAHWQPIVLTAGKLHEHYDTVRLKTVNAYKMRKSASRSGYPGGRPLDRRRAILDSEMERLEREEGQGAATGGGPGIEASPMDYLREITAG